MTESKINNRAVAKAAELLNVAVKDGDKPSKVLGLVRERVADLVREAGEDALKCETCGEVSTDATPFCPFCGDTGDEPAPVPIPEPEPEPAAIVPDAPEVLAELGKHLDESLERLAKLRKTFAVCSYDIGLELKKIHDEQLYKARGHASFSRFCEAEIKMSRSMAHRLIRYVGQFSRDQFEAVGVLKLELVASVPDPERRDQLIEEAKTASASELRQKVADTKGKADPAGGSDSGEQAPPASVVDDAPPPALDECVTVLSRESPELFDVPFVSLKGRHVKHVGEFVSLNDKCYAEVRIGDDTVLRIALDVDKKMRLRGLIAKFVKAEKPA